MSDLKHTPLIAEHRRLGGKLVEFGGWEMPVYYTSITDEHLAVRRACGVFDISHMGEVFVSGQAAAGFLNALLTNDICKLQTGDAQYTLMCNPEGGVIDDLYVYRTGEEEFLLIVNASRIAPDLNWIENQARRWSPSSDLRIQNASDALGAVAVQGPAVVRFIDLFPDSENSVGQPSHLRKNQVLRTRISGKTVHIARTGYTGEDGFEIVAAADLIEPVWKRILALGEAHGIKPCGLGARDTLRTEMCYPLYGHELDEATTPIEAGLGFFVALDKGDFAGREKLAAQKAAGAGKKLVAFKMSGKSAPPRPGYPILAAAPSLDRIGSTTSGTQSPSLGIGIGLGYVSPEHAKSQTAMQIEIRGKGSPAVVVPKPIYRVAT